jgi:biotin carboxylase
MVVGGGIEAVPGIRLAQQMGLHVVVSDREPAAPGLACADDAIVADTYDVAVTVEAARRYHERRRIDGVLCIATDVPLTVASVAEALRLPGITTAAARLATDKLAMKERFRADGVPIPWFTEVRSRGELAALAAARGLLVLKPVDSRGARGVLRLTPEVDLAWAYEEALSHSPSGRIMVEQFLPGPQVSTESLVIDGVAHTPGFSDRNYEYLERFAPHIIENGGDLPSRLPRAVQDEVRALAGRAARSLGIDRGVVKGDIVVSNGRAHVIEVAARLSGGYFCSHEIPWNTGVELLRHAIDLALGARPAPETLLPRFQRGVCQRYLFPAPGRVTAIRGVDAVRAVPGIRLCELRVREGDLVAPYRHHPMRAGLVMAVGESRREAQALATWAARTVVIETEAVDRA